MEPAAGDPGVSTCACQLALKGQSVYYCFLLPVMAKKGKISGWKSATDPTGKPYRHQRAIGRERDKRDHYPFKCPGDHGPGWSVHFLVVIGQVLTLDFQRLQRM